jgi:hypothetical protein
LRRPAWAKEPFRAQRRDSTIRYGPAFPDGGDFALRQVTICQPYAYSRSPSHRGRRRLFLDRRLVQLPEIAVTEKPADHVRRDQLGAERVKLVSGRKLKLSIPASRGSLETSMEKAARLDHDHATSAGERVPSLSGQSEDHRTVTACAWRDRRHKAGPTIGYDRPDFRFVRVSLSS